MGHAHRATSSLTFWHLIGATILTVTCALTSAFAPSAAADTGPPTIWVELEEMRPPCKENCFRYLAPPGIAIVGSGFAPFAPVHVRFVSLDGSSESFVFETETYSADGRFTAMTGDRVCNGWDGSPLEASGLPDEHAWEVRAESPTAKPGVTPVGSNILYLFTCGDGPVG